MKKIICSFLICLSFFSALPAYGEEQKPAETNAAQSEKAEKNEKNEETKKTTDEADTLTLASETAILIEASTGEVLYKKNAEQKMYPASITKLMTILLALENGSLTDEITFSHDAVYSIERGSAHIAIQEGETLTVEQVLRAIILRSANEASNGIAEYVDGSIEEFAKHMTARAKELGCKNTNFVNANGLHNENHYTTAHDMALIAKELLTHADYRKLMSETYYEIPPTNKQTETRYLHGQHQMLNQNSLYYYQYAIGGKTGFTSEALNTLVTYANQDDMELIAVVMKSTGAEHYTDTTALFEYGFTHYEMVELFSAAEYTKTVRVTETYREKPILLEEITVTPTGAARYPLPIGTKTDALKIDCTCPESIEAPVTEGQAIGTISVTLDGEALQSIELTAPKAVARMTEEEVAALDKAETQALLKKIGIGFGCAFLVLCIVFCVTRTIGYLQYQKRRELRRKRRRNRR